MRQLMGTPRLPPPATGVYSLFPFHQLLDDFGSLFFNLLCCPQRALLGGASHGTSGVLRHGIAPDFVPTSFLNPVFS